MNIFYYSELCLKIISVAVILQFLTEIVSVRQKDMSDKMLWRGLTICHPSKSSSDTTHDHIRLAKIYLVTNRELIVAYPIDFLFVIRFGIFLLPFILSNISSPIIWCWHLINSLFFLIVPYP